MDFAPAYFIKFLLIDIQLLNDRFSRLTSHLLEMGSRLVLADSRLSGRQGFKPWTKRFKSKITNCFKKIYPPTLVNKRQICHVFVLQKLITCDQS